MGKRELLLIVGFVILGAVVYQATAPPPGPDDRRFSVSRFLDHIRREVRGNRASAETTTTSSHALTREVTEMRLHGSFAEVTIVGEERTDIETTLRVHSNAYDEAEAEQTARETVLLVDRGGATIAFHSKYPDPGRQRAFLTMHVPARLRLRLDSSPPGLRVTGVAAVEMPTGRFEAAISRVAGQVDVNHRGGSIKIEDVGSLKLSGRGTEAVIARVRGEVSISTQGGDLDASDVGGPVDIQSSSADVAIRNAARTRGPIRIDATAGTIAVEGLQAETRIDGRNADITIVMSAPAAVAIYSEGEERIAVTPPPGGYTLDARATDGRITLPEDLKALLQIDEVEGEQHRAAGAVDGGGPTITLRSTHGTIALLPRESLKSPR
jgi:hypothetical protein